MKLLDALEVETAPDPELCCIWLHGLGADGHDFEPIVPELALSVSVRFVFPHAPVRPVTINQGMRMRAWYDILGFSPGTPHDLEGIRASALEIEALIDRETARGFAPRQVVLAGFSQGGAVALYTALRARRRVAGVIALSTYLPPAEELRMTAQEAQGLPIFMAHGRADPVIALSLAERSRQALEALGCRVEWHSYAMEHAVCAAEIDAISAWINALEAG